MAEDLGAIASTPSGHPSTAQPSSFAPAFDPDDTLPSPEEGAMGVIGDAALGGPSGGNNPAQPGSTQVP